MKNISILLIASVIFSGCLKAVYFDIDMHDTGNTVKTSYLNGKIVQKFYCFPYHGGSIAIQNNFSFDQDLVINLDGPIVLYHETQWKLHFIGPDLKKDTLHINGDDNISTLFSLPSWYRFGDTLKISFDGFVENIHGSKYCVPTVWMVLRKTKRRK